MSSTSSSAVLASSTSGFGPRRRGAHHLRAARARPPAGSGGRRRRACRGPDHGARTGVGGVEAAVCERGGLRRSAARPVARRTREPCVHEAPGRWGDPGRLGVGAVGARGGRSRSRRGRRAVTWIRSRHPQRETPEGLAAASRWLGVRAELAANEVFPTHSPLTVELWNRLLAYGAALGVAGRGKRSAADGHGVGHRAGARTAALAAGACRLPATLASRMGARSAGCDRRGSGDDGAGAFSLYLARTGTSSTEVPAGVLFLVPCLACSSASRSR